MKLTATDVCEMLQVDQQILFRWIREDKFPAQSWDSRPYFHPVQVLEWAIQRTRPVLTSILGTNADRSAFDPVGLFRIGGIFHDVPGTDSEALMANLIARLPFPVNFDRTNFLDLLQARGLSGTLVAGGGIALPQALQPIIVSGITPSATLCFTQHPVTLDAFDGLPVSALFFILAPTMTSHLQVLIQLTRISQDPKIRQCLSLQQSEELIFAELERYEGQKHVDSTDQIEHEEFPNQPQPFPVR